MTGPAGNREGGADALSQKDIDQLLKNASSTAGATQRRGLAADVVPYNFLRPPRISKDRRVQLEAIGSRFALAMQGMMSSRLRMPTDVNCMVEQVTLSEYVLSIANPCAAYIFNLGGRAGGQGALDISTELGFFIIDRVFGGPGESTSLDRGLTPLERSVVRGVAEKTLVLFREAWQDHIPFTPELVGFESTPDMLQFASREDNVLVMNVEVRTAAFGSLVTICLPLLALESFLGEKTTGRVPAAQRQPAVRQHVELAVRHAVVDIAVRFPPVRLSARDVAGLRVGQIIQTTHATDGPIELHINGSPRFVGVLGQYRRMLGVRIAHAVTPIANGAVGRPTRGRISE